MAIGPWPRAPSARRPLYDAVCDAPLVESPGLPSPSRVLLDRRRLRRGDVVAGSPSPGGQRLELVLHVRVAHLRGHRAGGVVAPDPRGPRRTGGPSSTRAEKSNRPSVRRSGEASSRRPFDANLAKSLGSLAVVDLGGTRTGQARAGNTMPGPGRVQAAGTGSSRWPPPSAPSVSSASWCSWSSAGRPSPRIPARERWPRPRRPRLKAGTTAPGFSLPALGGGAQSRCPPSGVHRSSSTSSPRGVPIAERSSPRWRASPVPTPARWPSSAWTRTRAPSPTATRLLGEAQAAYPVALDEDAKVATQYLVQALPVTYFLDAGAGWSARHWGRRRSRARSLGHRLEQSRAGQ